MIQLSVYELIMIIGGSTWFGYKIAKDIYKAKK